MNWYLKALRQYLDFNGRARRAEYWVFRVYDLVFLLLAMLIDMLLGTDYPGMFFIGYNILLIIPRLAAKVRRLHDSGNSGWMILLPLIPLIGTIWMFILLITDSEARENQYGPNPKLVYSANWYTYQRHPNTTPRIFESPMFGRPRLTPHCTILHPNLRAIRLMPILVNASSKKSYQRCNAYRQAASNS